VAVVVVVLLLL
jgi:hypothetical protein